MPEYTVSEISGAVKRTLETTFGRIRVRGELTEVKRYPSGHIYLSLKDESSKISGVVWKTAVPRLGMVPENGTEVIATGRISAYGERSSYQLIIERMEYAGVGALLARIEMIRQRLANEGLFDAARKLPIPGLPRVIGVVTSERGAVIQDIKITIARRFPRRILVWPVPVQGEGAAERIAEAIEGFDAMAEGGDPPRPDVLIVARGGGSLEDLMAFNDEAVIRAVAECRIPLISAVGHETDTTLIDYAADVRAPTPTAAAEMAVPVRTELLAQMLDLERRTLRCFSKGIGDRRRHLSQIARVLPRADQLFAQPRQRFDYASERLGHALRRNLQQHERRFTEARAHLRPGEIANRIALGGERTKALSRRLARAHAAGLGEARKHLESLGRILESISYRAVLERGFALVTGEDGAIRRRAGAVAAGEGLTLTFADGTVAATAGSGGAPAAPKPKSRAVPPATGQGKLF
jgi:exodeoxyribonuclease VII large subunit